MTSLKEFEEVISGWSGNVAADTETWGKAWGRPETRRLLGISFSPEKHSNGIDSIYLPYWVYSGGSWSMGIDEALATSPSLQRILQSSVGHNFTYDKRWLALYGHTSNWIADTRIMWHLASAPSGPRPYGLKDAQKELLGWENTNEDELAANVKAKGGSLRNGDHYLADLDVLAKYACLDTYATMKLYKRLEGFFHRHDYWPMLCDIMAYNELLEVNTYQGVRVDVTSLQRAHKRLIGVKEAARGRFFKAIASEVAELEEDWRDRHAAKYKRAYNADIYLKTPEKWERFNLNSDLHKRELFYNKLSFPVLEKTKGGKPSTAADSIKHNDHPAIAAYLKYEKANTLTTSFSGPYLGSVVDSRLHPGFNICGTVSYRLSGFKPYLLNAPFDAKQIMRTLHCDEGFIGVHSDLFSIEPCVTAHYSEDKGLLKVFRDGLGDIYLDLALFLFPNDKELHEGYNPYIPITKAIKERFNRQRKVAKVIQLAVQYTGTERTVARNLSKEGIPTTQGEARSYVDAYWKKFYKVADFNGRLKELNRRQGYLRNVIGRIIRVPDPDYKDLSNRFIQSSAHDVLVLWVLEIYKLARGQGIDIKPILLDCHDSTSNMCPIGQADALKKVYQDALDNVVDSLNLSVKIKAEIKTFKTLAGLKNEE